MKKICGICIGILLSVSLFSHAAFAGNRSRLSNDQAIAEKYALLEPITKDDRILILAPHPDDEIIGCAGVIQKAVAVGAPVRIAYLTNGDANQLAFIVYEKRLTFLPGEFVHMGEVRRKEAIAAVKMLGLSEKDLIFFGYPDFGTFAIMHYYWDTKKPYRSLLSRQTKVPYKNNYSYNKPYVAENILQDLVNVLLDFQPTKVFVTHPADSNGDHRAYYLFFQAALNEIGDQIAQPKVYSYLVHCVGWPLPRHYHPEYPLISPVQLRDSEIIWQRLPLTAEEIEKKHKAVLCNKSQTSSSAFYLLSFVRSNELFGSYPNVVLFPPPGKLSEEKKEPGLWDKALSFLGMSKLLSEPKVEIPGSSDTMVAQAQGSVSYGIADEYLFIRIQKNEERLRRLRGVIYLFGASDRVAFPQMPKITVFIRNDTCRVLDKRKVIKDNGVRIELKGKEMLVKVPISLLGNPTKIWASVKTFSGINAVDISAFRAIIIDGGK